MRAPVLTFGGHITTPKIAPRSHRALAILAVDPGRRWRPAELAEPLGCTTTEAAHTCMHLWYAGKVERHPEPGGGNTRSTYSHKEGD